VTARTIAALLLAGTVLYAAPAAGVSASATGLTCAAGVTTHIGTKEQRVVDLEPAWLPVLAYAAKPREGEFMALMRFNDVPIRLYVYRVTETLMHMQIFEPAEGGKSVLADTPVAGDMGELTWRSLGGSAMVTAYCY
jgi:hypothetical protein